MEGCHERKDGRREAVHQGAENAEAGHSHLDALAQQAENGAPEGESDDIVRCAHKLVSEKNAKLGQGAAQVRNLSGASE